jgi:hypothetical protein
MINKKFSKKAAVLGVFMFSCIASASVARAEDFPELKAKLAMCEGTYAYAIQYFQITGKVGAAQNLLMRYSSASAASLWINRNAAGVIPASRVAAMKTIRSGLKSRYDGNPQIMLNDLSHCDSVLSEGRKKASEIGGTWDGQSLTSLEKLIAAESKARLNLQ